MPGDFKTRPNSAPIDINKYLGRLGLMKELPSLNYLRKLHRTHLQTFPFENLDIHFGRPILLDVKKVFQKVIQPNRGGICFELNLIFYHLLIHLGYDTHLISAKVWNASTNEYGPDYDHMAMLVKIQNEIYLCDVGFGDGFFSPIRMKSSQPQLDLNKFYKVHRDPDSNFEIQWSDDNVNFRPMYLFAPRFREPIEFIDRCDYHQRSEESIFKKTKIISLFKKSGFVKLTTKEFTLLEGGQREHIDILNEDAFYAKMEEHFGISRALLQRLE